MAKLEIKIRNDRRVAFFIVSTVKMPCLQRLIGGGRGGAWEEEI
jgi:hypothetical protein